MSNEGFNKRVVYCLGEHTDDPVLTGAASTEETLPIYVGCRHAPPMRDINQIQPQGIEKETERETERENE